MKIRTDFVTNSSASSFVTVTFALKNKEQVECEFEEKRWDEYHMPDYYEGRRVNEGSLKGCNERNNVQSVAELLVRILKCTDSDLFVEGDLFEVIDYPYDMLPFFIKMYRGEVSGEKVYEVMNLKYTWLKDVYKDYDENFSQWIKDTFLSYSYEIIDFLEKTKCIDTLSDITSIDINYSESNWGSCFELWMNDDASYFIDDGVAEKETKYNYIFRND